MLLTEEIYAMHAFSKKMFWVEFEVKNSEDVRDYLEHDLYEHDIVLEGEARKEHDRDFVELFFLRHRFVEDIHEEHNHKVIESICSKFKSQYELFRDFYENEYHVKYAEPDAGFYSDVKKMKKAALYMFRYFEQFDCLFFREGEERDLIEIFEDARILYYIRLSLLVMNKTVPDDVLPEDGQNKAAAVDCVPPAEQEPSKQEEEQPEAPDDCPF